MPPWYANCSHLCLCQFQIHICVIVISVFKHSMSRSGCMYNVKPLVVGAWVCIYPWLSLGSIQHIVLRKNHCPEAQGSLPLSCTCCILGTHHSPYLAVEGECHWPVDCLDLLPLPLCIVHLTAPCSSNHQMMHFLPFLTTLYFSLTHLQYYNNCHW